MASKYDSITTAADLVREVKMHGLSTEQDDLNRAADIFGHSTVEELDELANNIGRLDKDGKPDPNGSWSGGVATRDTFYFILFKIWNWEEATRFWNQHSNEELKKLRKENEDLTLENEENAEDIDCMKRKIDEMKVKLEERTKERNEFSYSLCGTEAKLEAAKNEIMMLKAKLYDMMMEKEEK